VTNRLRIRQAHRIVVKVGSSSLTDENGLLAPERLKRIVATLSTWREEGRDVTLVTSGAQAAGIGPLGLKGVPGDLPTAQAAASVGQGLLIGEYTRLFSARSIVVGQVLLTLEDVVRHDLYRNARATLDKLWSLGAVPIVNENDTVATDEIRFGDNDRLAALVAHLVHADLLILLTDVDALYTKPPSDPGAQRVAQINTPKELDELTVTSKGSAVGTGGMTTKVEAAAMAMGSGIPVLLADANRIDDVMTDQDFGTFFNATGKRVSRRKLWLAYAAETKGTIYIDSGAAEALMERGRSLLPAGVIGVRGRFSAGDPVRIATSQGKPSKLVGKGISGYSAHDVAVTMGRSSDELRGILGPGNEREVVHRDSLVVFRGHRII
jgi:glutamate 5-kinase